MRLLTQRPDGRVIIDVDANLEKFNTKLKSLTGTAVKGLAAMGAAAGAAIGASIKVGKEFESAFAGVRKTVEATEEEFKQLEKSILDMSTQIPATAAEIAGIAEAAGQLGIQNKNIIEFTRVMADLGVATNMSGDAAATTLARFANITQMAQEDFDRLGSSIVALGNNLATTESEIADMALNIAGAATQVGFTEAQILALSGALSSVGIEAQAGGTAVSTLIINMKKATVEGGDDLRDFAKAANMTADEFKKAFEEDAAGAIQKFIEGLATAEERGSNAFQLLEEAGINEARMTRAMLSLSGASDVLANAFEISNKAWEENNALSKEAAERYETTDSKLQILQNSLALTGITIFDKFKAPLKDALNVGIEGFDDLNKQLSQGELGVKVDKISQSFTQLTANILDGAIKAIPPFIDSLTWLIDNSDKIIATLTGISTGFATFKAVKGLQALSSAWNVATTAVELHDKANRLQLVYSLGGLSKAETAVGLLTGKIKLATVATTALKALTTPLGMGLAIAGITALTVGYVMMTKEVDETNQMLKEHQKELNSAKEATEELTAVAIEKYSASVKELEVAEKYVNKLVEMQDESGNLIGTKEEIENTIYRLNGALGDSIYWYDQETGKIMDNKGEVENLTEAVQNLIQVKKGQAWLDANMELYTEALKQQTELTDNNAEAFKKYKDIVSTESGAIALKLMELQKAFDENRITQDEYNSSVAALGEIDYGAYRELHNIMQDLAANDEKIKANEDFIKTFDLMADAVDKIDIGTIEKISSGITVSNLEGMEGLVQSLKDIKIASEDLALLNEQKGMGLTIPESVYNETVTKIENLKDLITDMTGLDYDESFGALGTEAFNAYIEALEEQAQAEQERVNSAVISSFGGVEEVTILQSENAASKGGEALSTRFGETLDNNLPREGKEAMDLLGSSIDGWISAYNPSPIYIPIKAQVDPSLSGYGYQPPGATYDGTSGSSIIPDFSNIMDKTRSAISRMTSRVGTVVLGSKDGQVVENNKNIVINQNNNFNVPIEKPSEATRKFERTTKELANKI